MKWELLTKKGYEITNKRILGNPSYTSEETKNKDLIQELALVQEWLRVSKKILVETHGWTNQPVDDEIWAECYQCFVDFNTDAKIFKTPLEALISGIEYTINNLI